MDASEQSQITVFTAMDESGGRIEDNNTSHVWTVLEVEALLKLYRARESEFKDPTTKKKAIWQDVCLEMNRQGFSLNPMQCECKLKNMKATYRKSLEKAAERGIDPSSRCPFYEELYEIFGLAPPLRTFPESSKMKKTVIRKRHLEDEPHSPVTQVSIPHLHHQENGLTDGLNETVVNNKQNMLLEVFEEPNQQNLQKKNYSELVEALLVLRRSLEKERQLREEERKKYDEERRKNEEERDRRAKEFHEERMAMLSSMNKLICNLGSKN